MKRAFLTLLTALFLISSLPATVGLHPLSGGDAGTGQDAPGSQADAWPIEAGELQGDLLAPLDDADWYSFDIQEPSWLLLHAGTDRGLKVVLVTPANDTHVMGGDSEFFIDNTTGTWYIGIHASSPLPSHYWLFVESGPMDRCHGHDCDHGHCHEHDGCDPLPCDHHHPYCIDPDEEPRALTEEGANGTITRQDAADHYTITADGHDLLTFVVEAPHDAGIAVTVRRMGDTYVDPHGHGGGHDDPLVPQEETVYLGPSTVAQWFRPHPADLLVTVRLVYEYKQVCDSTGCETYERIGNGGDYLLHVSRESDIAVPDLAIDDIREVRRPIRTELTPDAPNMVNEERTIEVQVANLGPGTARWGGHVSIEMSKDRGLSFEHVRDVHHIPSLAAGETATVSFDWDTTTALGDYTFRVSVLSSPEWFDVDPTNNKAEYESYVRVGGAL